LYKLITTENCSRCNTIKSLLNQKNISYQEILAYSLEGIEICKQLNIKIAGTIIDENNNIVNINEI